MGSTEHPADPSPPQLHDPSSFDHWAADVVRFSDQDGVGHINNVAVAAYVETGRVAFGHDLRTTFDAGAGFILARLVIDYRAQAHYPGDVRIGTRLLRVGNSSFTVGHGVFVADLCIATAEGVLVFVEDGRPAPIAGELRHKLEDLLGA
jgi:acyl-CoA thioester hydrolase